MKLKFNREIKTGLMVIAAIFIFYFGINFLKGTNIFEKTNSYYGQYKRIDGLVESSQVVIKGYKVGQVSAIDYDFSRENSFRVRISVDKSIKLPKGTIMLLRDDGLLGGKIIELVVPINSSNDYLAKNDEIPSEIQSDMIAMLTEGIVPKIERMVEQTDSLMVSIQKFVENPHINNSLYAIEQTTNDLSAASAQLKLMMNKQLPSMMDDMAVIASDFKQTSGKIKEIDFASVIKNADYTVKNLQSFTERLNSEDNSLGLLMNDKNLYLNLNNTAESADKLLIDLKENPKRYVHFSLFGNKKK